MAHFTSKSYNWTTVSKFKVYSVDTVFLGLTNDCRDEIAP